jgi:hypothetical protein
VYAATDTVFLGNDSQEHAPVTAVLNGGNWQSFDSREVSSYEAEPFGAHGEPGRTSPTPTENPTDHDPEPVPAAADLSHSGDGSENRAPAEPSDSRRAAQEQEEQAAHAELIAARAELSAARRELATARDQADTAQDGGARSKVDAQQRTDRAWERLQRASRTLAAVAVPPERPAPRSVLDDPAWLHSKAHTAEWFEPEARPVSEADIQRGRESAPVSVVETEMRDVWREPGENNHLRSYFSPISYDLRRFTVDGVGVQDYTIRVHLESPRGAVDALAVDEMKQRVRDAGEKFFNAGYRLPSGDQFHVTVEFVPTEAEAHASVKVIDSADYFHSDSGSWWIGAEEPTLAHELGHLLGLHDTYVDEKTVFQQPGSRRIDDTGLMGVGYYAPDARLKPRDLYLIETRARSAGSLPEPESGNYRTVRVRSETDAAGRDNRWTTPADLDIIPLRVRDRVVLTGGERDFPDTSAEDRSIGLGLSFVADEEAGGLDDLGLDLRPLSPRTSAEVSRPGAPPLANRAPADRGEGSSGSASHPYRSGRPSRHAPSHGSTGTVEQPPYGTFQELWNDLWSTSRPLQGLTTMERMMGPDIFGLRQAEQPPAFMADHDYRRLTAGQGVSLFEKLDLAPGGKPSEAEMDPRGWGNTEEVELRGAPRRLQRWAPGADTRLDGQLTLPKAVHSIWLGGPLTDQVFKDNLANTSRIGRGDRWTTVLWTDVSREEFTAARQATRTGQGVTPRLEAVRAMQLWARKNQVKLVNVGEVFNARQPMALQHPFATEMNKQVGPGYAAASDILRLEILERFGGVYADGDNQVQSLQGMRDILDSPAGFAISQAFMGGGVMRSNSTLVVPKGHPFVQLYRDEIRKNYEKLQGELVPELRQLVQPHEPRLDRARRNSVMYRTGPTAMRPLLERLGLDPGNSPSVDGITTASAGSWLNPQPEQQRVASADRPGTLLLTQRVVSTLIREMYNRGRDLNLVLAKRAAEKHEDPDLVLNAAIHYIASEPGLAPKVATVTYAVSGYDNVELPEPAKFLIWNEPNPNYTRSGEVFVYARMYPIAGPTLGTSGATLASGSGR